MVVTVLYTLPRHPLTSRHDDRSEAPQLLPHVRGLVALWRNDDTLPQPMVLARVNIREGTRACTVCEESLPETVTTLLFRAGGWRRRAQRAKRLDAGRTRPPARRRRGLPGGRRRRHAPGPAGSRPLRAAR